MTRIHTMIERPNEIRRALLEGAINATQILKIYEDLKEFEDQKEDLKKQIQLNLTRMTRYSTTLKKGLPDLPKDLEAKKPVKPIPMPKQEEQRADVSPRDKIDRDLREIRSRIHRLRI